MIKGTHATDFFDKSAAGNMIRPESVTIDFVRDDKIIQPNGIGDFAQCMQLFETE
ncbi:MAG: hypothetical protein M3380_16050 [Chloroflexota bacterium]|nr:hypothetical protein [Chloroflexota bacterium]